MCLGDLAQVVAVGPDETALVRTRERTTRVFLMTLDEPVSVGEWLVCHSGFALRRVTPEEAATASTIREELS
jgi:hydrogenase expression/formation protein HypC